MIGFLLSSYACVNAQTAKFSRPLKIDVGIVSLGNLPEPGLGVWCQLRPKPESRKICHWGRLGYVNAPGHIGRFREFRSDGHKSERFTADFSLYYEILRSDHHALRFGVGPSAWLRKDDVFQGMTIVKESAESEVVTRVDFLRRDVEGTNFGGHMTIDYEYALSPVFSFGVRGSFAQFNKKKTDFNSMVVVSLTYRL